MSIFQNNPKENNSVSLDIRTGVIPEWIVGRKLKRDRLPRQFRHFSTNRAEHATRFLFRTIPSVATRHRRHFDDEDVFRIDEKFV